MLDYEKRLAFLQNGCGPNTLMTHKPLLSSNSGRLNPSYLGFPGKKQLKCLLNASTMLTPVSQCLGQSSVGFGTMAEYIAANEGPSLGRAEYGVVGTNQSVALAAELNKLYHGKGAIIVPSGMAAIETALGTLYTKLKTLFPDDNFSILVPEHVYGPVERLINYGSFFRQEHVISYGPGEENFEAAVVTADKSNKPVRVIYIESPV